MSPLAVPIIAGVAAGTACTIAELVWPARPIPYRKVVLADSVSFLIYLVAVYPAALYLAGLLGGHVQFARWVLQWPLPVRVVLYYLIADLGSYVLHRLMHTKVLWRVHKWHHAPTHMYWFAGVRATVQQQFLFNLPYVVATPILAGAPPWIFQALVVELIVRNDWMHMNVSWRSHWLEWLVVTPRYHHIHHSADLPKHLGNFGSLFTIWDRLFGTRIDPDTITAPLQFGTGEDDHAIRLIAGV
jgi:sterol desaturase/sphingolipid hydroxylase (fatty acid hydroxylase superfamily)